MAMYAYRGRSGGAVVSGEIEANDRPTAVTQLRARGVVATSVQERTAKPVGIKKIGGKVKDKHLAIYTRQFSKVFNDLFHNMLQVGESGGVLDVVLQRLSVYIEKAAKLKGKVKGAMVYPLTIISVAVLVIIFMMIFVIPTFAKMFEGLGAELPMPTAIVMWLSEFTQKYILVMVGVGAGVIYAIKRYYNTEQGSSVIDAFLLK